MNKKLVIFGDGEIADLAFFIFQNSLIIKFVLL